jgi:hypothetical protein
LGTRYHHSVGPRVDSRDHLSCSENILVDWNPVEEEEFTIRESLARFILAMEEKLQEKDDLHTSGWLYDDAENLFEKADYKFDELNLAIDRGQREEARKLAVDVANYVMMIFDLNSGSPIGS